MITEEQRKERINYLGSSDAAAVLGLSDYSTPLKVWAIKTGEIQEEDISGLLPVKVGTKMEAVVAELFEEETGKKVRRVNETLYHPKYPFIAANIDRRIVGEDALLEIKTAAAWRQKQFEDDQIPPDALVQVYHQLAVTGLPKAFMCVLIGNQDLKIKEIKRDESIINDLMRREAMFWNDYVIPRIMPQVITKNDGETLAQLFPRADDGPEIILTDEANQMVEALHGFKADIKNLEGLKDKTENELKLLLGSAACGATSLYQIQWTNSQRSRLDGTALEKELPHIHALYYKSKPERRFSYKAIKK